MSQISCGPWLLHWLTPEFLVSDSELEQGVHPSEWHEALHWQSQIRRSEYLRSRWLLRQLTKYHDILGKTPAGAPIWPPGLVGSLTHKSGFIGLVLAPTHEWLSIGIDAEDPAKMRLDFVPRLCNKAEATLLQGLAGGDVEHHRLLLTVLFSFKESLFKALFPLGETMFYFHDAQVIKIDQQTEQISIRLLRQVSPLTPAGFVLTGSYRCFVSVGRNFVLTCVGMGRATSGGTGSDSCG